MKNDSTSIDLNYKYKYRKTKFIFCNIGQEKTELAFKTIKFFLLKCRYIFVLILIYPKQLLRIKFF